MPPALKQSPHGFWYGVAFEAAPRLEDVADPPVCAVPPAAERSDLEGHGPTCSLDDRSTPFKVSPSPDCRKGGSNEPDIKGRGDRRPASQVGDLQQPECPRRFQRGRHGDGI